MPPTHHSDDGATALRAQITAQLEEWGPRARPSREQLLKAADQVADWRRKKQIESLWPDPPLMATATLDDSFAHGLEVIHRFAAAAGLRLVHLGKLLTPEAVVDGCRRHRPRLLGLTVLQFDTESDLVAIRRQIDPATRIVAGGPIFAADPDLAERVGIDFVARNAADFWHYLLNL
ncbi:MAG: cobalamin B12-binding domain-containing protein [Desulfobacteraceae bacterium]|jgi:methanogenic corrinoid protein MtbC1|nr:cobalamin B12-binding domain-containing protein [Desulfobacteraceae bacterium]